MELRIAVKQMSHHCNFLLPSYLPNKKGCTYIIYISRITIRVGELEVSTSMIDFVRIMIIGYVIALI